MLPAFYNVCLIASLCSPSLFLQIRCLLSTPVFVRAGQEITGVVQLTANERCVLSHDIPSCYITFTSCHMTFTSCYLTFTSCHMTLPCDLHFYFSSPDKATMSTWTSPSQAQVFMSVVPMISRIQTFATWVSLPPLLEPTKPIPRRPTGIHKPSKPW